MCMYSFFQPLTILYFLLRPFLRKNNPILCTPFVYLSFESIPLPVLGVQDCWVSGQLLLPILAGRLSLPHHQHNYWALSGSSSLGLARGWFQWCQSVTVFLTISITIERYQVVLPLVLWVVDFSGVKRSQASSPSASKNWALSGSSSIGFMSVGFSGVTPPLSSSPSASTLSAIRYFFHWFCEWLVSVVSSRLSPHHHQHQHWALSGTSSIGFVSGWF